MRPLFTIHAGEYVVGEFIEKHFKSLNLWIPSKDTGIDLLVTGKPNQRPISIQVKLSKDHRVAGATTDFERSLIAGGWLTIKHEKLANSEADLWIVVIVSHERDFNPRFIVIQPQELLRRLVAINGKKSAYHFYPQVTNENLCLDGRGLKPAEKKEIAAKTFFLGERDLCRYLDNWSVLDELENPK